MNHIVKRHPSPIPKEKRISISKRYHVVTKAINRAFWNSESDTLHSFYVGSYGRGTAIDTSDIDILIELPMSEYERFNNVYGNGQSRLLQSVRAAIKNAYPTSDIRADGQIIKINFYDGIQFELLPAFNKMYTLDYIYPDSNMGGAWKSTSPKAEQLAMETKNSSINSNGLLYATCKHLRFIRDSYFGSYKLSGIVIDSFVYKAMGNWRFTEPGADSSTSTGSYEKVLLDYYNNHTLYGFDNLNLVAPGSNQSVDATSSLLCLEKVLKKINT